MIKATPHPRVGDRLAKQLSIYRVPTDAAHDGKWHGFLGPGAYADSDVWGHCRDRFKHFVVPKIFLTQQQRLQRWRLLKAAILQVWRPYFHCFSHKHSIALMRGAL